MKHSPPNVEVLDIPLYDGTIASAVEHLISLFDDREFASRCISATGAHGIIVAREDRELRDLLQRFYLNLPDGMPGVWVARKKGATAIERCYGPDFFKEFMLRTASKPSLKHFLCGGMEGVAEELKLQVAEKFGNSNVVGTYCPPFVPLEQQDWGKLVAQIKLSGARMVWVGISTPKQEKYAAQLEARLPNVIIACVGAAFDFHTDRTKQAPGWMQRSGLEWLFRLTQEPKRLVGRYLHIVPTFIALNLKEFLVKK